MKENIKVKKKLNVYLNFSSQVIDEFKNNLSISLNPILHITRHFGPFVKLVDEFTNDTIGLKIYSFARFFARFSQALFDIFRTKECQSSYHDHLNLNKYDVIIISHADRKEYLRGDKDFYFGTLGVDLSELGLSVTYLYTNKSNIHFDDHLRLEQSTESSNSRWILRNKLDDGAELWIFKEALYASLKCFILSLNRRLRSFSGGFLFLAARGYEIIPVLRIYLQVKHFCVTSKARFILFTYEGHAWESAVVQAAKSASPDIVCIGYQHSSIFPMQYALRFKGPQSFRPDYIFCSGLLPLKYLRRCLKLGDSSMLINAGSINLGSALGNRVPHGRSERLRTNDLLVLLGGVRDDYELVVTFVCNFSLKFPMVNIRFRAHPRSEERSKAFFSVTRHSDNVSFSEIGVSLEDDLLCSRYACYRESTAIALAILCGCQPIFLAIGASFSVDTLYLLRRIHRYRVSSREELSSVLKSDSSAECPDPSAEVARLWGKYSFENVRQVFR